MNRSQWNCTTINVTRINALKTVQAQGKYQMETSIYTKQVPETVNIKV